MAMTPNAAATLRLRLEISRCEHRLARLRGLLERRTRKDADMTTAAIREAAERYADNRVRAHASMSANAYLQFYADMRLLADAYLALASPRPDDISDGHSGTANDAGGRMLPQLSLRQWYAGLALQGLLADGWDFEQDEPPEGVKTLADWQRHYAKTAVGYADAMLLELEKPAGGRGG